MLKQLIRMYYANMLQDVRNPIPHFVGPPGAGKSSVAETLAEMMGVKLHVISVARTSPLEIEGVQMPVNTDSVEDIKLKLLHNPVWKEMREGDVVILDEFLRGQPEVYDAFLDILSSRHVAGLDLPRVFFMAASNSVVTYDPALEDRLLHIMVPDIRQDRAARRELMQRLERDMALQPGMAATSEMMALVTYEIDPTYKMLDRFAAIRTGTAPTGLGGNRLEGQSARKLTGQARLRHMESASLRDLLKASNEAAIAAGNPENILYLPAAQKQGRLMKDPAEDYPEDVRQAWDKALESEELDSIRRGAIELSIALYGLDKAEYDSADHTDEEEGDVEHDYTNIFADEA